MQISLATLADGDGAAESQVDAVAGRLDALADYDPALREVASLVQSAQAELAEAVSALRRYADRAEMDPGRLATVEREIEAVLACARKLRVTPETCRTCWRRRGSACRTGDSADIPALEQRVAAARADYEVRAGKTLPGAPQMAAAACRRTSAAECRNWRWPAAASWRCCRSTAVQPTAWNRWNSASPGWPAAKRGPLAKVASGGELSRISLAIQVVASRSASDADAGLRRGRCRHRRRRRGSRQAPAGVARA